MSTGLIAALVAAAVAVFWVIGAHNRLIEHRNLIGQAWSRLHENLRQRAAVQEPLITTLRSSMAAEQGTLDMLLAVHAQAMRAAADMSQRPVDAQRALAWVTAEAQLAAAASRTLALLEQHLAAGGDETTAGEVVRWKQALDRLPFMRESYNEGARAYNEALALFPTNVLAKAFGFQPAGLI